jgi:phosphoglycolate phosphatase-like HAD superfamily hydrolase
VAREDAPPKPAPDGILTMLAAWGVAPAGAVYGGDYLYDIEAGRRAAVHTVLYAPEPPDFTHAAEAVVTHLDELHALLTERGNWR